jgi:hypothetical protein
MTYTQGIEWLETLAMGNSSTEEDSTRMQGLLRHMGFPKAVVVVGVVYPEGYGPPSSIHTMADALKRALEEKKS